jgi:hypothetical protein
MTVCELAGSFKSILPPSRGGGFLHSRNLYCLLNHAFPDVDTTGWMAVG